MPAPNPPEFRRRAVELGRRREQRIAQIAKGPPRLATPRATTRLRLPDCCVVLAAEITSGEVATFDERLAAVASGIGYVVRS